MADGDPGRAALVLVQGLLAQLTKAGVLDGEVYLSALHRLEDSRTSERERDDLRLARICAEAVIEAALSRQSPTP